MKAVAGRVRGGLGKRSLGVTPRERGNDKHIFAKINGFVYDNLLGGEVFVR
jgi:hypothetical protein